MIQVLLIDDHVVVREGLQALLAGMSGIRVVGQAATAQQGIQLAREKNPDVVLLDFRLPDGNGLGVSRKLLRYLPDLGILVVTAVTNEVLITQLLKAGVRGYLSKENSSIELERAIRKVHSGQSYLSPDVANRLALNRTVKNGQTPFDDLSVREMEVVMMVIEGLSVREISKKLSINHKTVNSYRYRAFEKLNIKSDIAMIKLAIEYGLIEIHKSPTLFSAHPPSLDIQSPPIEELAE